MVVKDKNIVYLWPFQVLSLLGIAYSFWLFDILTIILFFAIGLFISSIAENIGNHRYFAHKSFKLNKFWHITLALITTLNVSGPIVSWAQVHRNHHKHSDSEQDPHSPGHRGVLNVFFANWWWYRYTPVTQIPDYNNDPILRFMYDYYYAINIVFIVGLYILNPILLFPLYFYPTILGSLTSSIVNTYLHRGGVPHDSKLLAWLCLGDEGFHKYHHDNPGKWKAPFPNPNSMIINLIRKKT
jgi:stearoyl-CoA desaturase (delta-9 desaturase)